MKLIYEVKKKDNGKTIHEILLNEYKPSTKLFNKLIRFEKIYCNDTPIDTRNFARLHDILTVDFNYEEDNSNILPTQMPLDILYEDEWLLAINKPAGIPIHPSRLHYTDSLSNGVKFHFDLIGLSKKIRPVNRLDLNTSGLVIFAKCEYVQEAFIQQMFDKRFQKEYLCLVEGTFPLKAGKIDLPIARKDGSIIERCIDKENGQTSITHYEVMQEFENYSLVQCQLETGRTHQIRVHMAAINHPLLGDTLYGNSSSLITRQALHSYEIKCLHPITQKDLVLQATLPKDMKKLLGKMFNGI